VEVKRMIYSMTGYGRETTSVHDTKITVEIKTVNHRFLDFSIRAPKELLALEESFKKMIKTDMRRGRVELYITIDGTSLGEKKVNIDWQLLEQYIKLLNEATDRYNVKGSLSTEQLINLPDLFFVEEQEVIGSYEEHILQTVEQAVLQCVHMRKTEGQALERDLIKRISVIREITEHVKELAPTVVKLYKERLHHKLEEMLQDHYELDESRLLAEVSIFAEKADIEEEITRLTSHCDQFLLILKEKEPIGRKLDFLVQEMNRETNTIGAKANDYRISQQVVSMKSELEKIKEQVQNIE
jgi:uncharacterized protein (TIGR00255 family)